jgi:hypothetical protein
MKKMKKGQRTTNNDKFFFKKKQHSKNPNFLSLVRGDPIEERMQRRIFLQPMSGSGVFDSKIIDDLFVGDGREFLIGFKLAVLFFSA